MKYSVVDGGVNPEVVQKQQLQTLVDKNQKTNGKLQSIKVRVYLIILMALWDSF